MTQHMQDIARNIRSLVTYRRGSLQINRLFNNVTPMDYGILWFMTTFSPTGENPEKVYLSDIAAKTGLPMHAVSDMARHLTEHDLIVWTHDGSGEDGTYVQLSENGLEVIQAQRNLLSEFHEGVVEDFGEERFLNLLREMAELEEVTHRRMEKEGAYAGSELA